MNIKYINVINNMSLTFYYLSKSVVSNRVSYDFINLTYT